VGLDVQFVPAAVASPTAIAPRMTCLHVPTADALTHPSDTKRHHASPTAMAPRMTCLHVPIPAALTHPSDTKGHLASAHLGISHTRIKGRAFIRTLGLLWPFNP
jgi:hypothetical protein